MRFPCEEFWKELKDAQASSNAFLPFNEEPNTYRRQYRRHMDRSWHEWGVLRHYDLPDLASSSYGLATLAHIKYYFYPHMSLILSMHQVWMLVGKTLQSVKLSVSIDLSRCHFHQLIVGISITLYQLIVDQWNDFSWLQQGHYLGAMVCIVSTVRIPYIYGRRL